MTTIERNKWRTQLESARLEITRLQEANRKWSQIADERSKENVGLRQVLSACKSAMELSNDNGGRTDWRHMISAINSALQ